MDFRLKTFLKTVAVFLAIVFLAAFAWRTANAQTTAHITVHTYDGPVVFEFVVDAMQYTGANLIVTGHEPGDGIFRNGFED